MVSILIVDDNATNRKFLTTLLKSANYQILNASDGAIGLKMAREHHPDLIISDIMMPGMDGYEFVYHLRAEPDLVNLKVIFYTAVFFEAAAKELAKASGVCHFIVNPSNLEDILAIIEKVINDPSTSFSVQSVNKFERKHRQLIANKLYKDTNQLILLNEQLEQRIAEKTRLLEEANQALTVLSFQDQLTRLYNRRFLNEILVKEINRAKRHNIEFAVLLLDIDWYKKINDVYGHEAGDYVLQEISKCLLSNIRPEDTVFRYGGDEFVVIVLNINSKNALQRAERLRVAVETLKISYNQQELETITISIGVAIYPTHGKMKNTLIKAADASLYQAKKLGRNKIVMSESRGPKKMD